MKIILASLRYDYGIKSRGESLEYKAFYPALQNNFEAVIPFWFEDNGYPDDLVSLQKKLLQTVEVESPSYVFFILMNYEILPETLVKIKNSCSTLNWFCDDAWRYESYTKDAAKLFTHCITVDKYSLNKYVKSGFKNVFHSQWAAFDYVYNIDFAKVSYKYDVSFIGSKNPTREWVVKYLEDNGIKVACFGAGWNNGKVSYERMKEIFLESKINLNLSNSVAYDIRFLGYLISGTLATFFKILFSRPSVSIKNLKFYLGSFKTYFVGKKRVETIKARNFEIPGCGGFQLSQFALEIEDYYQIGKEISVFSNIEDLKNQINYYLTSDNRREEIRNNGYERTAEHTYEKRIKEIFKSLI